MTKNVHSYRVFVEPLAASLGGGFVSYAPELKGCVADGATPDDALHNIYDAIESWIDEAQRNSMVVPAPAPIRQLA